MRTAIRISFVLLAALAIVAVPALAQGQDFSKVQIKTNKISDNFYTLDGQGGTIGLLVGPDGIFMVDDQFAPLTDKIVAAIKQISSAPIKFVVNTHQHFDHASGLRTFVAEGATVITHQINKPYYEKVWANQHTLNDIIMTGDFYRSVQYPNIDRVNGGSLNGMINGLGQILARSGPNTKIIPGHGPTVDRMAVMAHRDMLLAVRDRISKMVDQGKSQDDVLAAKPTSDYDSKVPNSSETTQRFVTQVYAELKGTR